MLGVSWYSCFHSEVCFHCMAWWRGLHDPGAMSGAVVFRPKVTGVRSSMCSWGSEPRVPPSGTVTSEAGHWPRALEHGQAEAALPHLAPCPPPLAPCAAWAVGSVGCWAPGGAGREWAGQRGPHCATRFCFCLVRKREALIIPVQRHDV